MNTFRAQIEKHVINSMDLTFTIPTCIATSICWIYPHSLRPAR